MVRGNLGYDSLMFSDLILDHFRNPRNAGKLANASAEVQASNPVCGDILELAVRVEAGVIREARFLCRAWNMLCASPGVAVREAITWRVT